jgi:ribosomal-protein-alanine N-acetyltransferase
MHTMLTLNFTPFPILKTERLVLRQLALTDAAIVHRLRSDPEFNKYIDRAASTSIADAEMFIQKITNLVESNGSMYWAITLAGDDTFIGSVCLWNFDAEKGTIEIGYELAPEMQGQGIMAEAVNKVINYGFKDINATTITAFPSADNGPSIALLKRAGFTLSGRFFDNAHQNVPHMLTYLLKR